MTPLKEEERNKKKMTIYKLKLLISVVVLFLMLHKTFLTFESVVEVIKCEHLKESY